MISFFITRYADGRMRCVEHSDASLAVSRCSDGCSERSSGFAETGGQQMVCREQASSRSAWRLTWLARDLGLGRRLGRRRRSSLVECDRAGCACTSESRRSRRRGVRSATRRARCSAGRKGSQAALCNLRSALGALGRLGVEACGIGKRRDAGGAIALQLRDGAPQCLLVAEAVEEHLKVERRLHLRKVPHAREQLTLFLGALALGRLVL
jgi:hypothetical protein